MGWLQISNLVICILFLTFYSYQIVYIFISLFRRPKTFPDAPKDKRYASSSRHATSEASSGFSWTASPGRTIRPNWCGPS